MNKELIGKTVKVYKDIKTKRYYEGDGIIKEVTKKVSSNIYIVNCAFPDDYFTCTIDTSDILY